MLTLIAGRSKSGKTRMLLEMVKGCPARTMASRVVLVPEQLSHETERLLSRLCGDEISFYSEVLSFTRLYSRVTAQCGGGARPVLDQGGRILAVRLALDTVRPQLKVFGAAAGRGEFLTGISAMLDELKAYSVTPERLRQASAKADGLLSDKLRELGLILSAYEAVTAQGTADPRDRMTLLRKKLLQGDYGEGRYFFVDGFTDFSAQELEILETLLRTGQSMTVTVPCGDPGRPEAVFAPALETFQTLRRMGEDLGQEVRVLVSDFRRPLSRELTYLERLFSYDAPAFSGSGGHVTVLSCQDRLEECRACGAILKKHAMAGMRYREMAVCCGAESVYGQTLSAVFSALGIPLYRGEKRQVLSHPAVRTVLLGLECAVDGMEREDVLAWLKTGYSGLQADALDAVENYAITWGIRGGEWKRQWTMHPEGYDGRFTEETAAELEELNRQKDRALSPLFHLREALRKGADTAEKLRAVYAMLEELSLRDRLQREIDAMTEENRLEEAQETAQIWSVLLELLGQMNGLLGKLSLSDRELLRIFRLTLEQYQVGSIPPALDAVSFGSVASIRGKEPKLLFVLGANEGVLPYAESGNGLLSEKERQLLREQLDIPLAPDAEGNMQRELLNLYWAFTAPTEKLFVSWPEAGDGETLTPSFLVTRLKALFPQSAGTVPGDTVYTVRSAAETYLSAGEENPALRTVLGRAAGQVPELEAAISQGQEAAEPRSEQVSPDRTRALFGDPVALTASRMDRLGACPLDFFLYYGLRARPRKEASFDAAEFGTFVHFIMERTVPSLVARPGEWDREESLGLVESHMAQYEAERLEGIRQTSRQRYLLTRNRQEAALLLQELSGELSRSDFVPCAYELSFGGDGLPALEAEGRLGKGRLRGFVDRADLWHGPDGDYLRVVDYKTGVKKFDYTELWGGVGMQMLLYLFSLKNSGIPGVTDRPFPAGVLYFPARRGFSSQEAPEEAETGPVRRSGLVLGEEQVLSAMEHGESFSYLPVKRQKSGALGDYALDRSQMALLEKFVSRRMALAADQILGGSFSPRPFYRGISHDPCSWCDFAGICQKDRQFRKTCYREPLTAAQFWQRLEEEMKNG